MSPSRPSKRQMAFQVAAFLAGLLAWWRGNGAVGATALVLTLALGMMLGSVSSLLIAWRALRTTPRLLVSGGIACADRGWPMILAEFARAVTAA